MCVRRHMWNKRREKRHIFFFRFFACNIPYVTTYQNLGVCLSLVILGFIACYFVALKFSFIVCNTRFCGSLFFWTPILPSPAASPSCGRWAWFWRVAQRRCVPPHLWSCAHPATRASPHLLWAQAHNPMTESSLRTRSLSSMVNSSS